MGLLHFVVALLWKSTARATKLEAPDPLERQRDPHLDALMDKLPESKRKQVLA